MRPCLYCGDTSRPRTKEHVLQDGFNTSWVLTHDVCSDCNSAFSRHDTKLIEFVRSLAHATNPAVTPRSSFLQGLALMRDPQTDLWLNVRIRPNGQLTTFDQVLLPADGRILPICGDASSWQDTFATITNELSDHHKLKLEVRIPDQQPVTTAIVRSAPFTYLIVAPSAEEADRAKRLIESGGLGTMKLAEENPGQAQTIEHPTANIRRSYNMANVCAALVKTAVNFVCATLGPEIARSAQLQRAREYVLSPQASRHEDYVTFVFGDPPDERLKPLSKSGHHTIGLFGLPGATLVTVLLYEEPFAVVHLATEPVLAPEEFKLAFFDYRSRKHELITALDNPEEIIYRFLGIRLSRPG